MELTVNLISAAEQHFGIGFHGDLPWKLKNEMAYFHRMTSEVKVPGKINVVVMGRKTYFSNPVSERPFKGRFNIVLSKSTVIDEPGVLTCASWNEAMEQCKLLQDEGLLETVWVIGGEPVYKKAVESPYCNRIYLTRIFGKFECDTFFPGESLDKFDLLVEPSVEPGLQEENGIKYKFEVYERKRTKNV